jgi:homoserine dehydrogenase
LNGTSNFVLDQLTIGVALEDAIQQAQRLYAEADATDDLSGLDAARKMALMGREAFGLPLAASDVDIPGPSAVVRWRPQGGDSIGRFVASVRRSRDGCVAAVELVTVDASHPLAACRGASNAVVVTLRNGSAIELRGRGAGRWPTAESVMGDLLELWRDHREPAGQRTSVLGEFEAVAS